MNDRDTLGFFAVLGLGPTCAAIAAYSFGWHKGWILLASMPIGAIVAYGILGFFDSRFDEQGNLTTAHRTWIVEGTGVIFFVALFAFMALRY